jgi:hypothetical protein
MTHSGSMCAFPLYPLLPDGMLQPACVFLTAWDMTSCPAGQRLVDSRSLILICCLADAPPMSSAEVCISL